VIGRASWLLALGLFAARPALAEDADDLRALLSENVITTASTSAQKASTAPATSVTLTAEDLNRYGIRSLAEAINFLSLGVTASETLRAPDVGARGVLLPGDDGKHFLLLINGHALNDPLYGAARFDAAAAIPLDVIDHIEVIVGPGSVLYGSNAMLGVINVITKRGSDYKGGHVLGDYEFGRSARAGGGAGFTFTAFGAPGELTASVEHFSRFGPQLDFRDIGPRVNVADGLPIAYRRDGSRAGFWGGAVNEAYFTETTSAVLRARIGDFELSLLGSTYRRGIPYTTAGIQVDFDDPDSYELDRALRFDLKHQATLSPLIQLTSRLYGDTFDYQRAVNRDAFQGCYASGLRTCQYYDAGLARWAGVEERLSFNWLEDLSLVTLIGVDARMQWAWTKQDATDFETGRAFRPTSGQISESAAIVSPYLQQTWSPAPWLDLNAGARVDADERFDPIVSPRGAFALSPSRTTTLRGIYSQAFRAPTWSETHLSNNSQARSRNVEPEQVRSIEGSIEQRFATQRLMFGVFRSWWDNMIEPHALTSTERNELQRQGELLITASNVIQYRNISSLTNYGYNGGWDGSLDQGRLGYGVNATAAFTRRHTASGEERLPVAPQFFGNARISYAFGGYVPTPALAAYYVGQRPADRAFAGLFAPEPYAEPLAELRFTLSGAIPGLVGLRYRASSTYATEAFGPYAAGPGRAGIIEAAEPASLAPIDRFRAFVGISYDFWTGAEAAGSEEVP
jgi:outer membrane receptor for ferrienterochelin and colicins